MADISEAPLLSYRPTPDTSREVGEALRQPLERHDRLKQERERLGLERGRLARETQRDHRYETNEKAIRAQREREMNMTDQRERQRAGLAASQEGRRAANEQREHADKDRAEHEQLLHDWQMALQIPDPQARASAVHFAADALHRAGFQVEEYGQQFGSPPAAAMPASQGPVPGGIEDVGELQNGSTPGTTHAQPQRPMLPGEASSVGRQLDQAGARYMGALTSRQRPSAGDARLSGQLDAVDSKYMSALAPPTNYKTAMASANASGALGVEQVPGGWEPIPKAESDRDNNDPSIATPPARAPLPGQSPFAVTRSSQLLSQDDPYNNIR